MQLTANAMFIVENIKAMFGIQKIIGKGKKNTKENDFLIFGFTVETINKIQI